MRAKKPPMIERMGVASSEDAVMWDGLVQQLLGPKMPSDTPDLRRSNTLQLAAAALRAAGERELVAQVDHLLAT
ncbi:hypothetical protein [Pseudomonas carassii]|uniref:Uncharacterized protein n=1 Tax=Pseudomonas carassii TaxID=3115855 RepID=A0ABU7H508_9PSED|nr:hypothetical protein [Pseudomonas sp. 137P]MEE1886225.1 hypothetical protein [Pseudomonas sp. 137P]